MQHVMVRYTVKPGHAAENERLIEQVFAELTGKAPQGIRYAAFKLDDGASFVHVFSHEHMDDADLLRTLPAFQAFRAGLGERCEAGPVRTPLHAVGAYGFVEASHVT